MVDENTSVMSVSGKIMKRALGNEAGRKDYSRSHEYLVKLYFAVNNFYYAHFGTELLHLKTDVKPIFSLLSLQTLLISPFLCLCCELPS